MDSARGLGTATLTDPTLVNRGDSARGLGTFTLRLPHHPIGVRSGGDWYFGPILTRQSGTWI